MNKFTQLFRSRAFWTIVAGVIFNALNLYGHYLSPDLATLINLVFGAVTAYFHVNVSQVYTPAGVTPPPSGQAVTQMQP
jgi:hypothetical protein